MMFTVTCSGCGISITRSRRDRHVVCQTCARAQNREHKRAVRAAAPPRVDAKRCIGCWTGLPLTAARNQRYCDDCAAERERESRRLASQRMRAKRSRLPNPNMTEAGGACARVRADNTLNRGKCKRRCPDCARLYCPDCLEAPCPACGNHLTDNPLEVSRVQAA